MRVCPSSARMTTIRARAARSVGAFFESLAITTRAPNPAVCKNDTVRARSDACNEMSRARPTAGA